MEKCYYVVFKVKVFYSKQTSIYINLRFVCYIKNLLFKSTYFSQFYVLYLISIHCTSTVVEFLYAHFPVLSLHTHTPFLKIMYLSINQDALRNFFFCYTIKVKSIDFVATLVSRSSTSSTIC